MPNIKLRNDKGSVYPLSLRIHLSINAPRMSKVFFLVLITALFPFIGFSQNTTSSKLHFGIEQDLLPYATGGYFAGFWAGKKHVRVRTILARVHKPDLIVTKGFTNNKVTAYALVGDYFLKEDWKGWWAGSGLVYWNSSIQSEEKLSTISYKNVLLNGSLGYNWKFYKQFYLSPWAGLHLRVGGAKRVDVDGRTFAPALLNPEASVKVGVVL